jgi:hypothetical protein
MFSGFSGMVTSSQTREEAFGSMRTFQAVSNSVDKKPIFSIENQLLALALVGIGALLIAFGPYLSGTAQTLGSWCHHGAGFSAKGAIQELVWMASQHCGYCYLGAAMIGIGIATGLRRTS